jgi:O-antigen ligase
LALHAWSLPVGWRRHCANLALVLACLLVSVPFLLPVHYFPLPLFYAEWLAFALGLAVVIPALAAGWGAPLAVAPMAVGLLALALIIAAQQALGRIAYAENALLGGCYVLWAALLIGAGAQLRRLGGERCLAALLAALAVGGVLASVLGFVQYYQVETPWGRIVEVTRLQAGYMFGSVGQRNTFSDYVACGLVALLFLCARGSPRGARYDALYSGAAALSAALMAAALALAASRTSLAYAVIVVLATLAAAWTHRDAARRMWPAAAVALCVYALVQYLALHTTFLTGPQGAPNTPLGHLSAELATGQDYRPQLYARAWHAFAGRPLFGIGFGELGWNMYWQAAGLAPPVLPKVIDHHAHNLVLQLLAEFGVAGLAVLAVPAAMWGKAQFARGLALERMGALFVLAVLFTHSMVEFPLWIAQFLGLFALLVGLAAPPSFALRDERAARATRLGLLAIAAAGVLLAGRYFADYRDFESWFLGVENKERTGIPTTGDDLNALLAHDQSLLAPYLDRVASESIAVDAYALADKLALNTRVMHAFPIPTVAGRQGLLLELAGRDPEARRTLRAMALLWPEDAHKLLPQLQRLARQYPDRFAPLEGYLREVLRAEGYLKNAQENATGGRDAP